MNPKTSFDCPENLPKELVNRIPTIRVIAMPADANASGDIFGGWLLSQMDLAGAAHAHKYLLDRVVTVGIKAMDFYKPVFIGDEISFYTTIEKVGTTSLMVHIDSWAFRRSGDGYHRVTEGLFTYVRVDENRRPKKIEKKDECK